MMKAYRVTKIWSATKGTRWALVLEDPAGPAVWSPFPTADAAYTFAVENEIPVYESWDD